MSDEVEYGADIQGPLASARAHLRFLTRKREKVSLEKRTAPAFTPMGPIREREKLLEKATFFRIVGRKPTDEREAHWLTALFEGLCKIRKLAQDPDWSDSYVIREAARLGGVPQRFADGLSADVKGHLRKLV